VSLGRRVKSFHNKIYYKRPHISQYLRNNVTLSEKLPILAAPLRFVAFYALNPSENSYKPLLLRNYALVTFFSPTLKAMFIQSRIVSYESHNIRTSSAPYAKRTLR